MKVAKKATKERTAITFSSDWETPEQLPGWLREIEKTYGWKNKRKKAGSISYLNVGAAFDIETTSWTNAEGDKRANMYIWMVNICGKNWFGRTWSEFLDFLDAVSETLQLSESRRIIFGVHNLSFEFQFIKDRLEWLDVFALDLRAPVYAVTTSGIEFRCTYTLHGASLAHMGNALSFYKLEKKVGDLDYNLMRHSQTPLTETEMGYCMGDVQVVTAYLDECIRYEKNNITRIPLTKTGYPRRLIRKNMLYGRNGWRNRNMIKELTYEKGEFILQHREFAGGFTHGSAKYVRHTVHHAGSNDLCSSYPAHMMEPGYPVSKGTKVVPKDMAHFRRMCENFCCLFNIRFTGVREKAGVPDHILSFSKCWNVAGQKLDNGRIISADSLEVTMNEVDFECFEWFYDYDTIEIGTMYRYRRGYMPKEIIETVLNLYYDKTMLKGVEGRETDYRMAKENVNSCYGMMVTNPIRDKIEYTKEKGWVRTLPDYDEGIGKYNDSMSRFSFYSWGCYITSLARKTLYKAILAVGEDFVYSDTDSVKYLNPEKHQDYFKKANEERVQKLRDMCSFYHLDFERTRPKGKQLGVWEYECTYDRFRCLGAKRYLFEIDGKINLTVSGLDKRLTAPWMVEHFEDPFEAFDDELDVPAEATGKLTHTYIDIPFRDLMVDYTGIGYPVSEQSCVHLEPAPYSLSLAKEFLQYLNSFLGG